MSIVFLTTFFWALQRKPREIECASARAKRRDIASAVPKMTTSSANKREFSQRPLYSRGGGSNTLELNGIRSISDKVLIYTLYRCGERMEPWSKPKLMRRKRKISCTFYKDLQRNTIKKILKQTKHGIRNVRFKSSPHNSTINCIISTFDIQKCKNMRETIIHSIMKA